MPTLAPVVLPPLSVLAGGADLNLFDEIRTGVPPAVVEIKKAARERRPLQ